MTTENQEGQRPVDPEVEGQANPTPSDQEGVGNLSEQGKQLDIVTRQEFASIMSEIRGLQSKMDKDAAATKKQLMSDFEDLTKRLGIELTPAQTQQYQMYQLERQVQELQGAKEAPPAKAEPKSPAQFAEVFKALDISEPSEDQMRLAMEHADDPLRLAVELTKRQLNKPTPTPGSTVVPGKAGSPPPVSVAALIKEYDSLDGLSLSATLAGGKTVMQRRAEIAGELERLEKE